MLYESTVALTDGTTVTTELEVQAHTLPAPHRELLIRINGPSLGDPEAVDTMAQIIKQQLAASVDCA